MTNALLHDILALRERREPGALCTIVKTEGSTPLKAGAQMLVQKDGSISGTIGGGALEFAVLDEAAQAIASGESKLFQHRLTLDHNMCCGGTVHVFVEAIPVPPQCFIFGAGHVGKALASLLASMDFEIVVIDGRENIFNGWRDEGARNSVQTRCINEEPDEAISSLKWDSNTFAVIATHSHPLDREILRLSLRQPFQYCGMIGSKRKIIVTRNMFLERGWATEEALDRIDMPIGIPIAASSPAEIAVSIAAKIIEVKNGAKSSITQGVYSRHYTSSIQANDLPCNAAAL
ncbi:MAG TPA: xanthine dehydrogenase accessory protein XdhC [Candidatus Kapabacteria bacterium]|nr:xanthine dehydrogenase accessory protein XdhC [Candidatus Kapabacteria bacterium]